MLCSGLCVHSITFRLRGEGQVTHWWVHKPCAFPLGLRPMCSDTLLKFLTGSSYHDGLFMSWWRWENDPLWEDRFLTPLCPAESPKAELVDTLIRRVNNGDSTPNDPVFHVMRN